MRRILLLLIVITPILSFSQENNNPNFTISGKIIDAVSKEPLEFATVIFKSTDDANQIKFGGITNQKGRFSIDVEMGTYNASVEFLSYITKKLNISTISRDFNIGTIELEADTEFLSEVEIIGEKKALEFKPGKIVYNVGKDISAAGGSVTDILNNIPSVSVNPDGGITLRGQGNVTVMINGKISSMSKFDALKSIPAGSVEKIETIANPGAKYKASSLGIINIILKKGKDEGLNGSITGTGGFKDYYGGLVTLNNKSKKINFFVNASYFQRNPIRVSVSETEYFNNGMTTSFLNEKNENNSKDNVFYSSVGADFYVSPKTTVSTSLNYSNIINNGTTITNTVFLDAAKIKTADNIRDYFRKFDDEIIELVVDFEHNFKKEGQKITSSVSYTNDEENYNNKINNSNINFISENYIEKNTLENTIVDFKFSNPIKSNSTLTVGYNGEFGKVPFTYSSSLVTKEIFYTENTQAAFLDFEHEGEKYYYGIGLRAEFVKLAVDYNYLNLIQEKQFNNLFPSASFGYAISDTQHIDISFNKGTSRPGYNDLQPFEQKYSETSSYKGNEQLDPMLVDMANLSYTFSVEKISFSSSMFFQRYNNYFQPITYETGEQINGIDKFITTPFNIGKVDYYGVDLTTTIKPSRIINFTGNIYLYNFDQSGFFEITNLVNETITKDYNHKSFNGSFSLLTQLKIPNVFDFQTNVKHFLISKGPYSTRKAYTYASAAINKDLFNKEASISLSVDDIFKSRKTDRDRFDTNYFSKSLIENKYRTILLSFTYRFNQSKKDRKIDFDLKETKPTY